MKKIRLTIFLILLIPTFLFSQLIKQKDSIITEMCNEIANTKNFSDSLRIQFAYTKHLYPYLAKFKDEKIDSIGMSIYYRFQRNCSEFIEILNRLELNKSDWEQLEKGHKPKSKLSKRKCRRLNEFRDLSYFEYNGDKVNVELKDGIWTDFFLDGTYSKLSFKWTDDCEFELEFIESNNETRKSFSNKGDTYNYSLILENDNAFVVITQIPNENNYLKFKIYTK